MNNNVQLKYEDMSLVCVHSEGLMPCSLTLCPLLRKCYPSVADELLGKKPQVIIKGGWALYQKPDSKPAFDTSAISVSKVGGGE